MLTRLSRIPLKTLKESPKDEESLNAKLLVRAYYIAKAGAGIYSFLPFGLRTLRNIERIVREEMNAIGAHELLLPILHPKNYWATTERWEGFDALYKIKAKEKREYALGATHEEIITPLAKQSVSSYKDLPLHLYQIQTKFRDETRAKSGLLRGREFLMKDLYSFHADQKDLERYYETVSKAYEKIFKRCSLKALRTEASGGTFSQFSHEYQVATSAGEDITFFCSDCNFARNKEIIETLTNCPSCNKPLKQEKTAEVGNIFKLGTKFSNAFDMQFRDKKGQPQAVIMGCYGIGVSRLMGTIAEVHNDTKGLTWPEEVAPFAVHIITVEHADSDIKTQQNRTAAILEKEQKEILLDDRAGLSNGEKFAEADLLGMPWQIILGKTLKEGKVELKKRKDGTTKVLALKAALKKISEM